MYPVTVMAIHRNPSSHLRRQHLEETGESVVECVEHVAVGQGRLSLRLNHRTCVIRGCGRSRLCCLSRSFRDFVKGFGGHEKHHVVEEEMTDSCKDRRNMNQIEKRVNFGSEKDTMDQLPFCAKELAVFA